MNQIHPYHCKQQSTKLAQQGHACGILQLATRLYCLQNCASNHSSMWAPSQHQVNPSRLLFGLDQAFQPRAALAEACLAVETLVLPDLQLQRTAQSHTPVKAGMQLQRAPCARSVVSLRASLPPTL
jgi:hypothetical protein